MNRSDILNIFYNEIVKEASVGRVDCYFYYNIIFNTKIMDKYIEASSDVDNLIIPTLNISNKELFDNLLVLYVNKALLFYDDNNFHKDAINEGISKEKIIMTLLWSNATWEDYADPCSFLRRRIEFFDNCISSDYLDNFNVIFNSNLLLDSDVSVRVVHNKLENETPYSLEIYLSKSNQDGLDIFKFPRVYFGIYNDCVYLYAMQNDKDVSLGTTYQKKINRLLYKVNSGFDNNSEYSSYDDIGNLKDITPSFLVGASIALGLFRKMGYNKIMVSSILISRWNSKRIADDYDLKRGITRRSISQLDIQRNLTDKFIRTFRRLDFQHSGINVLNGVSEDSSYLMLYLDENDECCNDLLRETYSLGSDFVRKISK